MATRYDAVVIGAGHNGLCCAAYLAKAGRKVLVLERRHVVGGASVTEEITPGFKYSVCSYVVSLLRPEIVRDLELPKHGYEIIPLDCTFNPYPDGRSLCRWGDKLRTQREIAQFSARDAEVYPEFGPAMVQLSRFVKPILGMTPPDPAGRSLSDAMKLLRLGRRFRSFSGTDRERLVKLMTMSAVDMLDEWFESDQLKAPMSGSGIIGTFLGVRSPGTAYVLLHHYMGEIDGAFRAWGLSRGGMGGIADALRRSAEAHGAEVRTSAGVAQIRVEGDQVRGVVLENGDEIDARTVVSAVDPRLTFLGLVGEQHLDGDFVGDLARYRYRGSSGKVNLALDGLPDFTARPGVGPHLMGDITIAPSIAGLERAYDEAKYGAFSSRPFLNIVIPSLNDHTIAPPGKHVMSIFVQYAPYHLKDGADAWPSQRDAFGDAVLDTLEIYCPKIRDHIIHRQVVTPWDLEKDIGLTEGNIFHGELGLEQLFFLRPVAGYARYRTPLRDLWMCGSGVHPGGGVMAAPGKNAALEMLGSRAI